MMLMEMKADGMHFNMSKQDIDNSGIMNGTN